MELLTERWAPVRGYEGMYEVSDCGRMKSMQRFRRGKSGCLVPMPELIMSLTPKKRSASGRTLSYVEVRLRDGSPRYVRCKAFLVHRLVAQAFVGELFEGCHVDHIDGDHQNNHWTNLRILSAREHGLLHPCIVNKAKHKAMQAAAQAKVKAMRAAGEIVGRNKALSLKAWNC
jgi:hypothetical protein